MQIGLYIHIPFCTSKCHYCDFLSFPGSDKMTAYVSALVKEIENYGKRLEGQIAIKSIFIGGGTPTVLPPILLDQVANAVVTHFNLIPDCEWTIESNPGTLTEEMVKVIGKYPITRISMGLQTTHNHLLKAIGRRHTFEDWQESMALVRKHTNCAINADLMFALPGQTLEEFKETLSTVVSYEPEHLSVYALIIEEGTHFGDLYDKGLLSEIDETLDRNMYHYAQTYLKEKGYKQYEISNWAKPGHECEHNIVYWQMVPYIGIGLGSHSLFEGMRYANETNIHKYIEANGEIDQIRHVEEVVTEKMAMEEYMFLELRMLDGIYVPDFEARFGVSVWEVYHDQLKKWIELGAMVHTKDWIKLSEYGLDVCNEVFSSFL